MASLLFYVRTSTGKQDKPVKIRVRFKDEGKQAYATTHLSLLGKYWNPKGKTLRAKIRDLGDFKKRDWFKDQLEGLYSHILISFQNKGEVTKEWLTETIERFSNPSKFEVKPASLFEFIEHFIEQSKTAINPKTGHPVSYRIRRDYERTFELLKEYAGNKKLDFDDIDLGFYNDFVSYLQNKTYKVTKDKEAVIKHKFKANTIGKFIKNLKVFLNKATEEGINTSQRYKSHHFVKIQVETDSIYLNEEELKVLEGLNLSDKPYLERTRDLFLAGCWTGLRFGDLSHVKPENIKDGFIYVKQSKTGDRVVIPLHPVVTMILGKYDGKLPSGISNQKTNDYLKAIGKLAGLNEEIHITETRGGIKRSIKKKKYELISSHTARRSFATNLYKSGFPSQSIMKITGHKSESSFLKYLKVTEEEHARLLQKHWIKSNSHLKVV